MPPTTVPPTTVEGQEPPPSSDAPPTTEAGPLLDPDDFPDEAPGGAFGPALFALLTDAGVPGNAAHCTIVTAFERGGGEGELVPLLLAADPDALELVGLAGADCGVPAEQIAAAIQAGLRLTQPDASTSCGACPPRKMMTRSSSRSGARPLIDEALADLLHDATGIWLAERVR